MENIYFRGIPTSLFLNGPKLGIITDPQDQQSVIGIATFTGIATATFPDPEFSDDGGFIQFKWYYGESRILDTCEDINSNATIVGFSSEVGTGSTITISGLTSDDNDKEIYFEVDFVPSAYAQPTGSVVTAGTARSTGNAYNEPLRSQSAKATTLSKIEVIEHPEDVISTLDADFDVVARINPENGETLNYQWQINEVDLIDGNAILPLNAVQEATFTITGTDGSSEEIDVSNLCVINDFKPGVTYTLTTNENVVTKIFAEGAGGGSSAAKDVSGGRGGAAEGVLTFAKNQTYKLRVGGAGASTGVGGFSGGGNGTAGGGGGGFTGLFQGDVAFAKAIIIAGGGGGGSNGPGIGGDGGGLLGLGGSDETSTSGIGGTQVAATGNPTDGTELQGGTGAAGGGGGYYGGAGGDTNSACIGNGAGGGGSAYIGGVEIATGQEAFTTPGTYSWTAPSDVTSVSVVCVGGGGGGAGDGGSTGGFGGGLGWKNNISVVPGQSYTVVVGSGGKGTTSGNGGDGGDSYFIDLTTVAGLGGDGGGPGIGTLGGNFVGDGGGRGGGTESVTTHAHGGGGAGGYSGNGGFARTNNKGSDGSGGAGGAGSDGGGNGEDIGAGGGGVGLLGEGESGLGGGTEGERNGAGGFGGSSGDNGKADLFGGTGGSFGGGGGQSTNSTPGDGAGGGVRIIWGSNRAFPSSNTIDLNESATNIRDGKTTTGGGADRGVDGSFSIEVRDPSAPQNIRLTTSGATTPNLRISSLGGTPPVLVGTSIVESDNGVVQNEQRTEYRPGTKGGPQTEYPEGTTLNELGGFTTPDQTPLLLMGSYSPNFVGSRSATWSNVRANNVTEIRLLAIKGNDKNGGERPDDQGEDLQIELTAGQSNRRETILIRQRPGDSDDSSECAWNEYRIPLQAAEQTNNLEVAIRSAASDPPEFGATVVCISVIDEDSSMENQSARWRNFRENFPNRPFYLLIPDNTDSGITIPNNFKNDPNAYSVLVNRDEGNFLSASDWFTITGLDQLASNAKVSLIIDNSGSLRPENVSASALLFRNKCAAAGIAIVQDAKMSPDENWIQQHNRQFGFESIPLSEGNINDYRNAGDVYGVNWIRLYNGNNQVGELSFNSTGEICGAVRCKLSADNVIKSPVFSKSASYINRPPRDLIKIEEYRYSDGIAVLHDYDFGEQQPLNAVCISVIDEVSVDDFKIDSTWTTFRATYSDRPFYLLQPGRDDEIHVPDRFVTDPTAFGPIAVNRDQGDANNASDWFDLCSLDRFARGTPISLAIDTSGSMGEGTVSASLELFRKKCADAGFSITQTNFSSENWVGVQNRAIDGESSPALIIDYAEYPGTSVCIYAAEKDLDIEMELHGGKGGAPRSVLTPEDDPFGGTGGYSKVRFTMEKGQEYMITGLYSAVRTPFVYRGANLIACVGAGGGSGSARTRSQRGGDGGGIGMAGEPSVTAGSQVGGGGGGGGGAKINAGELSDVGRYGSMIRYSGGLLSPIEPDEEARNGYGGRVLPSPRGVYWRQQGKTPGESLGEIKFRLPDGTELSNTATITRGYKAGYNIIQTGGVIEPQNRAGEGGCGATGGKGGFDSNKGGGGGSGYTDGSVTVVDTQSGASTYSLSAVVIRLVS